jgi:hypothetical protein
VFEGVGPRRADVDDGRQQENHPAHAADGLGRFQKQAPPGEGLCEGE